MVRAAAALMLCIALPVAAQWKIDFSNVVRYGKGWESGVSEDFQKKYFEEMADTRLLIDKFRLGLMLEVSEPPERVAPFRGIKKLYAEYVSKGLSVRAGTLYDLFGKGMALNLFEDRSLGYDTQLKGARAEYANSWLDAKIVGGVVDYADIQALSLGELKWESYRLGGATAEVLLGSGIFLGASYLASRSKLPNGPFGSDQRVNSQIPEIFAELRAGNLNAYVTHIERYSVIDGRNSGAGGSTYGSFSYVGNGYGLTVEYKDYRLDLVDPITRVDADRPTRVLAFQNPPTLIREHSFSLLMQYPHVVDFGDEVGIQTDFAWTPVDILSFDMNTTVSSRHFAYSFDRTTLAALKTNRNALAIPSSDWPYSPYWEVYGEGEWRFNETASSCKLGIARRNEVLYEIIDPDYSEERSLTGLVGQLRCPIHDALGMTCTGEYLWMRSERGQILEKWYDWSGQIELSWAPVVALGVRYDETSWNETPGSRRNWVSAYASARLGASNTLELSYGSERGGIVCTNGICRVVNPFDGFRMDLTTHY